MPGGLTMDFAMHLVGIFMHLPLDCIMFFQLFVHRVRPFFCSFIWTDLVTTMSLERLEQSR